MSNLNDINVGDQTRLGPTVVEREAVLAFAQSYDPQAFHLSDEAASATYFGRLSASGWHTVALAVSLLSAGEDWLPACRGAREIRDLRWRRPVYPGDRLWVDVEVRNLAGTRMQTHAEMTLFVSVVNQESAVVAEFNLVVEIVV